MTRGTFATAMAAAIFIAGCHRGEEPDAYGAFEATDVVVSSETSGRLLRFVPVEGNRLEAGATAGLVDTTSLSLERSQSLAQRGAAGSRAVEVERQLDLLKTEQEIARRTFERTERLYRQQAATAQQFDQAERDYRSLSQRIETVRAQRGTAADDVASSEARVAQVTERIRKSQIVNPVSGTVLTKYAEPGEFVQPGQPLYKIASLDSMILRAYVTEPQLAQVKLGQAVQVTFDISNGQRRVVPGRVEWVSSQAEFTPTPIQTREERADLVYAIKIRVANPDGAIKIGMPADVHFAVDSATR